MMQLRKESSDEEEEEDEDHYDMEEDLSTWVCELMMTVMRAQII